MYIGMCKVQMNDVCTYHVNVHLCAYLVPMTNNILIHIYVMGSVT